jgi:selenide,water dikinase
VLRPVRETFDPAAYPDLLVGLADPDDAAVWRLSEDRALVVTTDFFTPVVDDPYQFGAIAAANALSDVYAMGGKPFLALNIVALPEDLPPDISAEILRGGAEKAREAGVVIAGGHSVKDKEPKYGLVVIGYVDPKKMLTKGGLQLGDNLVITKPLGFGVTTTALKQQKASPQDIYEVVNWMTRLNKSASALALEFNIQGGTDITGFGLLGHGIEMASSSGLALEFDYAKIPFVNGAKIYAQEGHFPGGGFDNRKHYRDQVTFPSALGKVDQMLLFDPQTSGGLMLGIPDQKMKDFLKRAKQLDQPAWLIGRVVEGSGIRVT